MATAVVTFVGTKAVDAEATGGWNTGSLDNDIFVEGSGSIGAKTSNSLGRFYDLTVAGGPYNFTTTHAGYHIYAWMASLTPTDSHRIIVADDLATDSIGEWDVGPAAGYTLGFANYVINPAADFSRIVQAGTAGWTTTGNPGQLTGVDGFGGALNQTTTVMGNFNNALVDAISVGLGYRITNGDGASADATFADFITFENTTSNRFGALRSQAGVLFPLGKLYIGAASGATNTEFTDSGFVLQWPDANVASNLYALITEVGTGTTTTNLSTGRLASEADPVFLNFTSGTTNLTNVNANTKGGGIWLGANTTWNGGTLTQCGQIVNNSGTPAFTNIRIVDSLGIGPLSNDASAATILSATGFDDWADITFDGAGLGGTSQDAAIEVDIPGAGPFTINLDNFKFVNRVSGSVDMHFLANSNADYTVNVLNGGDTPTFTNDGTGTVTIVANPVAHTVTVVDEDNAAIAGARVFTWPTDNSGPIPYQESVTSITRSGSTATVTHTAHGLVTSQYVWIVGANEAEYNGVFQVTVTGVNTYTYTVSGTPATPATGTITATGVIINGTTNGSGVISYTRAYSANQTVQGRVREGTGAPFYKPNNYTSTITTTAGSSVTVTLQNDQ